MENLATIFRRRLLASSLVLLPAIGACVANSPLAPGEDGGVVDFDGAIPDFDAAMMNGVDATLPREAGRDASGVTGSDTSTEDVGTADQSVADTSIADTSLADANVVDALAPDANDAEVPDVYDAGEPDAADANVPDVFDGGGADATDADVADVFDAGIWCVTNVFGSYYSRLDGTLVYLPSETQVTGFPGGTTVTSVDEQPGHACALLSDETVWCWSTSSGSGNANGDLGNGQLNGSTTAFAATQVVTEPYDGGGTPTYLTNVTTLDSFSAAETERPTCAIRSDKTLWCWGDSTGSSSPPAGFFWGTIGTEADVPYAIPMSLSASDAGPDGGDAGPNPPILADMVTVGADHLCYVLSNQLYCLGGNYYGNLGNGDPNDTFQPYPTEVVPANGFPSAAPITSIGTAFRLTCALSQGRVWCWGFNNEYQVGNPTSANSVCNANYCQPAPTPVQIAEPDGGNYVSTDGGIDDNPLTGVTELVPAALSVCALSGGDLYCWGDYGPKSAARYTSPLVPTTNLASFAIAGSVGDYPAGLRYLTPLGIVSNTSIVTPVCP
jgi:hypothetical protein